MKTLTKIKTKAKNKVLLNMSRMKSIVLAKGAHLSRCQCYKTLFSMNDALDNKARMFVHGKTFQSSLIFVSNIRCQLFSIATSKVQKVISSLTNIRLG